MVEALVPTPNTGDSTENDFTSIYGQITKTQIGQDKHQ